MRTNSFCPVGRLLGHEVELSRTSAPEHSAMLPWASITLWPARSSDGEKRSPSSRNGEIFSTLQEAKVVIEGWRRHDNTIRPHSSLGSVPPAPEVVLWPAALPRPAPPATPAVALRPVMHSHSTRTTSGGPANWAAENVPHGP